MRAVNRIILDITVNHVSSDMNSQVRVRFNYHILCRHKRCDDVNIQVI